MSTPWSQLSKNISIENDCILDRQWLDSWLQPKHHEADSINSYRQAFESHPCNLVVVENFLNEDVAVSLSNFVNNEAEFETFYGLYSKMENNDNNSPLAGEAEWLAADEADKFFKLRRFVRLSPQKKLTRNFASYLSFLAAFKNPKFKRFFEQITGLALNLNSETYHFFSYQKGDFLRAHSDDGKNYLLAFIIYLTQNWEPQFGGQLNVKKPDGDIIKLEPKFNSLVLFDVTARTEHWVSVVEDCVGDRSRSTFSGWMHKPNPD
jgi:hypothetical protein